MFKSIINPAETNVWLVSKQAGKGGLFKFFRKTDITETVVIVLVKRPCG